MRKTVVAAVGLFCFCAFGDDDGTAGGSAENSAGSSAESATVSYTNTELNDMAASGAVPNRTRISTGAETDFTDQDDCVTALDAVVAEDFAVFHGGEGGHVGRRGYSAETMTDAACLAMGTDSYRLASATYRYDSPRWQAESQASEEGSPEE